MKSLFTKFVVLASVSLSTASAYAVGVSCSGGGYTVSLSGQNDITVANNGRTLAHGIATQSDYPGWQYLSIGRNVGPQPADVFESYTLVVPGIVGSSVFYGFLDIHRAGWGMSAQVGRVNQLCTVNNF